MEASGALRDPRAGARVGGHACSSFERVSQRTKKPRRRRFSNRILPRLVRAHFVVIRSILDAFQCAGMYTCRARRRGAERLAFAPPIGRRKKRFFFNSRKNAPPDVSEERRCFPLGVPPVAALTLPCRLDRPPLASIPCASLVWLPLRTPRAALRRKSGGSHGKHARRFREIICEWSLLPAFFFSLARSRWTIKCSSNLSTLLQCAPQAKKPAAKKPAAKKPAAKKPAAKKPAAKSKFGWKEGGAKHRIRIEKISLLVFFFLSTCCVARPLPFSSFPLPRWKLPHLCPPLPDHPSIAERRV